MSDTPCRDPETNCCYARFDLEKSDEELEEDILDWLEEVFGPSSDASQPTTTVGTAGRDEINNKEEL